MTRIEFQAIALSPMWWKRTSLADWLATASVSTADLPLSKKLLDPGSWTNPRAKKFSEQQNQNDSDAKAEYTV